MTTAMILWAGFVAPSAASGATTAGCPGAAAHPYEVSLDKIRGATRCLINARRSRHGLRVLHGDHALATAARRHSRRMVAEQFFSHSSLNGLRSLIDRIRRTRYLSGTDGYALGENILWGTRRNAKPRLAVKAWMHSPGHRSVMLSSTYRQIGIGVARGAPVKGVRGAATYTVDFGRRWP